MTARRTRTRRRSPTQTKPEFEAAILAALAAAFSRRGRALRYRGNLSIKRDVESDGLERLNVDLDEPGGLHRRLAVWATGEWWFLVCDPHAGRAGGWRVEHELRGGTDGWPPESIVETFKEAGIVSVLPPEQQLAWLQSLWRLPAVACG